MIVGEVGKSESTQSFIFLYYSVFLLHLSKYDPPYMR